MGHGKLFTNNGRMNKINMQRIESSKIEEKRYGLYCQIICSCKYAFNENRFEERFDALKLDGAANEKAVLVIAEARKEFSCL